MKATLENLTPGTRIKCVYPSIIDRYGCTARVNRIESNYSSYSKLNIMVTWDDGCKDFPTWSNPDSFEIIEDENFPKAISEYELYHGGVATV